MALVLLMLPLLMASDQYQISELIQSLIRYT